MRYSTIFRVFAALAVLPAALGAQDRTAQLGAGQVFETLPNGGIIELERAPDDSAGMRAVRIRLRTMAQTLSQGDLTSPSSARLSASPGVRVMTERRNVIRYDYRDLPHGAALRITTADVVARKAVWEFIAFERNEHLADP